MYVLVFAYFVANVQSCLISQPKIIIYIQSKYDFIICISKQNINDLKTPFTAHCSKILIFSHLYQFLTCF